MAPLKIKPPAPASPTSDFYLVLGSGLFLLLAMVSIPVWNDATRTTAPVKGTSAAPTLATLERPAPATRVTPTPPSAPSPAGVGTSPLYFAADLAPPDKIPPEAPLCYKFMVAGPEEQLKKLKDKYPDLYDYRILANAAGGKNLVAKRRDAARQEITYFYSTSPAVCNQYQQARLETQATSSAAAGVDSAVPQSFPKSNAEHVRLRRGGQ